MLFKLLNKIYRQTKPLIQMFPLILLFFVGFDFFTPKTQAKGRSSSFCSEVTARTSRQTLLRQARSVADVIDAITQPPKGESEVRQHELFVRFNPEYIETEISNLLPNTIELRAKSLGVPENLLHEVTFVAVNSAVEWLVNRPIAPESLDTPRTLTFSTSYKGDWYSLGPLQLDVVPPAISNTYLTIDRPERGRFEHPVFRLRLRKGFDEFDRFVQAPDGIKYGQLNGVFMNLQRTKDGILFAVVATEFSPKGKREVVHYHWYNPKTNRIVKSRIQKSSLERAYADPAD